MKRIQQNDTEIVESFFVDENEVSITGGEPELKIRRQSDQSYWNGSGLVASCVTVSMSVVDDLCVPGEYRYRFDTSGLPDATYTMVSELSGALNSPQVGELAVGGFVDDIGGGGGGLGSVVHIEGVFTKKEKERLMAMIADNFEVINNLVRGVTSSLITLQNRVNTVENKINYDPTNDKIDEMQRYLNMQTQLIESIEEERVLNQEVIHGER